MKLLGFLEFRSFYWQTVMLGVINFDPYRFKYIMFGNKEV